MAKQLSMWDPEAGSEDAGVKGRPAKRRKRNKTARPKRPTKPSAPKPERIYTTKRGKRYVLRQLAD